MNIPILIPAYEPDEKLLALVKELKETGQDKIIIIDDGSNQASAKIFQEIRSIENCIVCNHAVNLGKGRAIKTGINFVLNDNSAMAGVVTADADGQHLPKDIIKVQEKLAQNQGSLILGCRSFSSNIPFRSKLGNEITKKVFHFLTGMKVSDTQTGLRGIPPGYLKECIKMDGEKYEYEINMLISCRKNGISLTEVPIETVYIDNNRSSHFNPILDSIKIYFVLFRFLLSSLSTALVDLLVFVISTAVGFGVLLSMILSRLVAGNYNYFINKNVVFRSGTSFIRSFAKYWTLVLLLGSVAYTGIHLMTTYLHTSVIFSKILVESLLFFVSFSVQHNLIFLRNEES